MNCTCGASSINSDQHSNWCDYNPFPDMKLETLDEIFNSTTFILQNPPTGITLSIPKQYKIYATIMSPLGTLVNSWGPVLLEFEINNLKNTATFNSYIIAGKEIVDFTEFRAEEIWIYNLYTIILIMKITPLILILTKKHPTH